VETDRHIWQDWARNLHRWGVAAWIADLLEAAGPLATLGAQAVYLTQPLLRPALSEQHLQALAGMLEDADQRRLFVQALREGLAS
jgi:hypothetical protein